MKCLICKHRETGKGKVTVPLTRGETAIVIKDVPADICENCGEYYLSEKITELVYSLAETSARRCSEVEIVRFVG